MSQKDYLERELADSYIGLGRMIGWFVGFTIVMIASFIIQPGIWGIIAFIVILGASYIVGGKIGFEAYKSDREKRNHGNQ